MKQKQILPDEIVLRDNLKIIKDVKNTNKNQETSHVENS